MIKNFLHPCSIVILVLLAVLSPVYAKEVESDKKSLAEKSIARAKNWAPGEVYVVYKGNRLGKKKVYFAPDDVVYLAIEGGAEEMIPHKNPQLWKRTGYVSWPQNVGSSPEWWEKVVDDPSGLAEKSFGFAFCWEMKPFYGGLVCSMGKLFIFDKETLEKMPPAAEVNFPESIEILRCAISDKKGEIPIRYVKCLPDKKPILYKEYLGILNIKENKLEEICAWPDPYWAIYTDFGWYDDDHVVLFTLTKYYSHVSIININKKKIIFEKEYTLRSNEKGESVPITAEYGCLSWVRIFDGKLYGELDSDTTSGDVIEILYPPTKNKTAN